MIIKCLPIYGYLQTLPRPYLNTQEMKIHVETNIKRLSSSLPIEQPINERKNSIGRSHSSRSSASFLAILL